KKVLASEVTALLHGREAAEAAAETARKTFEEGALAEELPTVELTETELEAGIGVLTLAVRAGLSASTSEARRAVAGNAFRLGDVLVTDSRMIVTPAVFGGARTIRFSFGRKKHVLLKRV